MKRQWQFTLTRRVLDEPTRTTQHTYTVDSPQALELLVQRASKDRDVVAYKFERVVDEQYRWRPCDCHGHLARGNQQYGVIGENDRRQHRIVVDRPLAITKD